MDALRHAGAIAARCGDATDGTDAGPLFDAARRAIAEFADDHPAMRALNKAAHKGMGE